MVNTLEILLPVKLSLAVIVITVVFWSTNWASASRLLGAGSDQRERGSGWEALRQIWNRKTFIWICATELLVLRGSKSGAGIFAHCSSSSVCTDSDILKVGPQPPWPPHEQMDKDFEAWGTSLKCFVTGKQPTDHLWALSTSPSLYFLHFLYSNGFAPVIARFFP